MFLIFIGNPHGHLINERGLRRYYIYTPPRFEYFKSNRDPAMEAIMEYISAGKAF